MNMTAKPRVVLVICLMVLICMASCGKEKGCSDDELEDLAGTGSPTEPLGDIGLDFLQVIDDYAQNGAAAKVWFERRAKPGEFAPVGFIQIVRTDDLHNPNYYLYPSEEKKERATDDGWYVDRGEGYKWAIYGQMDNGSFADYVFVGSETDPTAFMTDAPYRPENQPYFCIRWQAVAVPVCISTDEYPLAPCQDERLGYYYWGWTVDHEGSVITDDDRHGIARESMTENVEEALERWFTQKGTRQISAPVEAPQHSDKL